MFEIVKMTHVCRYWRSTLISYPHLWSSIFVKNDHKDFVATCLERSREVPLAVRLDLNHGDYDHCPDCTCIRKDRSSGTFFNECDPCRYHSTIHPLLEGVHLKRIHTLDVHLTLLDNIEDRPEEGFMNALIDFRLFVLPLPVLESLNFRIDHVFDDLATHLQFPEVLFFWGFSPPTALRRLALRGCYGGPILDVRNLTSFELTGVLGAFDPIELDQDTFLPFISGNSSLVSLSLSHCNFPDRAWLSQVTPVELPELKTLQLTGIHNLSSFSGLVHASALKRLSSLQISTRRDPICFYADFLVQAESDDGFRLSYDALNCYEAASDWIGLTDNVDPSPAFVRFERGDLGRIGEGGAGPSPLALFSSAEVLEIGASFAGLWYYDFWGDLEKVGPQLATLRLEVIEGMEPSVAKSVETLARARYNKGMPLTTLERMTFEETSEEDEKKAKKLWEAFRAGLSIDHCLAAQ